MLSLLDNRPEHQHIWVFCCCRSSLVDISSDGSTLAIGSESTTDPYVFALKWNGTHYTQLLNSVPLQSLQIVDAISLSPDGNALAVGAYDYTSFIPYTTVYKVRPPGCMDNEKLLRISFTTDLYPEQNHWTVQYGNETFKSQPYNTSQRFMTYNEEICVPADVCIQFSVFDTKGDGINFPGGYSVMLHGIHGKEVASNYGDILGLMKKPFVLVAVALMPLFNSIGRM